MLDFQNRLNGTIATGWRDLGYRVSVLGGRGWDTLSNLGKVLMWDAFSGVIGSRSYQIQCLCLNIKYKYKNIPVRKVAWLAPLPEWRK